MFNKICWLLVQNIFKALLNLLEHRKRVTEALIFVKKFDRLFKYHASKILLNVIIWYFVVSIVGVIFVLSIFKVGIIF